MGAISELHAAVEAARPLMRDLEPHVQSAIEESQDELTIALNKLLRADEVTLGEVPGLLRDVARLVYDAKGRLSLILAGELEG